MTVANNNLPSALIGGNSQNSALNPVMSSENAHNPGQLSGKSESAQIQVSAAGVSKPQGISSDTDFETIMQQQLSIETSAEASQVVDKQGLNLQSINIQLSQDSADLDSQWIQNLKSHFNQQNTEGSEIALPKLMTQADSANLDDALLPELDIPLQAESGLPLANEVSIEEQNISLNVKSGQALPPSGQVVSAVMKEMREAQPIKAVNVGSSLTQAKPQVSNIASAVNVAPAAAVSVSSAGSGATVFDPSQPAIMPVVEDSISEDVDAEFNLDKSIAEKLAKNNVTNQTSVSMMKEAPAVVSTAASQASQTSAPITQNISASQLPPHLQSMALSPQSTNTQWGEALNERVSFLVNHKLNSAEIRLDPPHLGKLDIQIQVKDDSATITIHTQHAQTRDLIDSASARLREFLHEAGYDKVDVDVSHQEQSAEQQLSEQEQDNGIADNQNAELEDGILDAEMTSTTMDVQLDNGRIDYFA